MSRPLAYLSVKNFWTYQHYRDRRPPWIKLYRKVLDDEDFISMTLSSQRHYMILLLLAADTDNRIPQDGSILKYLLKVEEEPDLSELISRGFVFPWDKIASARPPKAKAASKNASKNASKAARKNALSETETESESETESETESEMDDASSDFEKFWQAYPKKREKPEAKVAWSKAVKSKAFPTLDFILTALEKQKRSEPWFEERGKFIPWPAKWLNRGRWLDELPEKPKPRQLL